MSKKTKAKKSAPASKKPVKASKSVANKKVAKQAAPAKVAKAKTGSSIGKAVGITVAVSAVVAAGLGVGGFFLGKTLGGNGGGGGGKTTGHTVVLIGGEGKFAEEKDYLVFNNVKDETALGDIEGYALPTYNPYTFEKWNGPIVDIPYGPSFKVTEDIVLTASFMQGVNYHKEQARNAIKSEYDYIIKEYYIPENLKAVLESIVTSSDEIITSIEDSDDLTEIKDAKTILSDLTECAVNSLSEISVVGVTSLETAKKMAAIYKTAIQEAVAETNVIKRSALIKMDSAYVKALAQVKEGVIDQTIDVAFDEFKKQLDGIDPEKSEDILRARFLPYYASAAILGSTYSTKKDDTDIMVKTIAGNFGSFVETIQELRTDDTDTINWAGNILRDYEYAKIKWGVLDPTEGNSYSDYVGDLYLDTLVRQYLMGENIPKFVLLQFNQNVSIVKALADARVDNGIGDAKGKFPSYSKFTSTVLAAQNTPVRTAINDLTNVGTDEAIATANKLSKCFTNLVEAFGTWKGDWEDAIYDFEYLFYSGTPEITNEYDSVILQATGCAWNGTAIPADAPLLDVYLTLSEKAIDLAKKNMYVPEEDYSFNYHGLFDLGCNAIHVAKNAGTQRTYKNLAPLLNLIVETGVDYAFPYKPETVPAIISIYKEWGETSEDSITALNNMLFGLLKGTTEIYGGMAAADAIAILDYLDSNIKEIQELPKVLGKYVKAAPNILVGYGEMLGNIYNRTALDIYNLCSSKETPTPDKEIVNYLTEYTKKLIGSINTLMQKVNPDIKSSPYYQFYFDTVGLVSSVIPSLYDDKLIVDTADFMSTLTNQYFSDYLVKSEALKAAINDNFVKLINPKMTQEEYDEAKNTTEKACQKIVNEK